MKIEYDIHWKREYSFFYGVAALFGLRDCYKEGLNKIVPVRSEFKDGWFSTFSKKGEYEKLARRFFEMIESDKESFNKEINKLEERGKRFIAFAKRLNIDAETPTEELKKLYKEYFDIYCELAISLFTSFFLVESTATAFEKALGDELTDDEIPEAIEVLSKPSKKAVLMLVTDYFKKEKDVQKKVDFILDNYPWLGNKDIFSRPWTKDDVLEYVKSFKVPKERKEKEIDIKNKKIVELYQEILYVKDRRDEYRREAFYYALPLVKELAKRLDLTPTELSHLLPDDLNKRDLKELIKDRKQGSIVEVDGDEVKIKDGKETLKDMITDEEEKEIDEFTGRVASQGIVKGKVQMVMSKDDLDKVDEGDVLVSVTTDPDYVVAMQKAAAFVTDEGGITCHAAIVAREMGKPCIVGTKIATKVLKTGDIVEVDAEKSIVRKIK